jgi:hypothetical protein
MIWGPPSAPQIMVGVIRTQSTKKLKADSSKFKAIRKSKLIAQCKRQPGIDEFNS